jgi:hypothetical protein
MMINGRRRATLEFFAMRLYVIAQLEFEPEAKPENVITAFEAWEQL